MFFFRLRPPLPRRLLFCFALPNRYTPFASKDEPLERYATQINAMTALLERVNSDTLHCERCHIGPIGKELGMNMRGTCLDYAFRDMHVPFSMAMEIFDRENPSMLSSEDFANSFAASPSSSFVEEASEARLVGMNRGSSSRSSDGTRSSARAGANVVDRVSNGKKQVTSTIRQQRPHPDTILSGDLGEGDGMTSAECFKFFNPAHVDDFEHTTRRWSAAILDTVAKALRRPATA